MRSKGRFRPIVQPLSLVLLLGLAGCAGVSEVPRAPGAATSPTVGDRPDRPTYKLGDRWIRSDGIYELIRIESDRYVFSAGPGDQIELTNDLAPLTTVWGGVTKFGLTPPPALAWPLEVGQRGSVVGTFKSQYVSEAYPAATAWVVEAYEDVEVPAGRFKAFRISFTIKPLISTNFGRNAWWSADPSGFAVKVWYAPEVRRFVKAASPGQWYLEYEVVAVDPEETAAVKLSLREPRDQARIGGAGETVVSGNATGGKGVAQLVVSLNGEVVSKETSAPDARKAVVVKASLKLKEGKNILLVTATDSTGASTQEARTLYYDPPLRVALPRPGQVARASREEIVLSGKIRPPTATGIWFALSLNGQTVANERTLPEEPEITLNVPMTLQDGENVLALQFFGPDAPPTPQEWKLILDRAGPGTPSPVAGITAETAPVAQAVEPPARPSSPVPPPSPVVSPPASPGAAAPVAMASLPPALHVALSTPPDQSRFEQETMAVAGLVSAGKGVSRVTIALNGGEISRQEERPPQRTVPVSLPVKLRSGQNTLVVTASDVDGTVSQEVRTVYYERPIPLSVVFRYPQDMAHVTDPATVAAAVVTSSRGVAKVSVSLNGVEVHAQAERSPQKSVLVTVPLRLRDGVNTIGITASEADGTVRQEVRTMLYEAPKVAAPPALSPPPTVPPDRWAVVIGVGNYESPGIPKLRYTVSDAEAIYQVLIGPAGFKKERVLLLTDATERKPTVRNIRWALGTFLSRSARKDDTVLIFFAGHGAPETDPRGLERDGLAKYLIPSDADPDDLYSSALPMDELQTVFGRIEAERVVAFLDACYSGAAGGRTFGSQRTRTGSVDDLFLERLTRSKGRVIITASRPTELSIELSELGHGIFTYYLIQGLKGAADFNRDGIVTLQELYGYVEQQVTQKSRAVGGNQHPVMKGELEGGLPLMRIEAR
jgi:hypothetical protein